jgi:hypothetical protein
MEDLCGDMDLKVAGTRDTVTSCQLDVKRPVPVNVLLEALGQNARGRAVVLSSMEAAVEQAQQVSMFGRLQTAVEIPDGVRPLQGAVLFFRHKFTLENAIESHACSPECSPEANMCVTNGIPLGCPLLLPVDTVNCVATLKAAH